MTLTEQHDAEDSHEWVYSGEYASKEKGSWPDLRTCECGAVDDISYGPWAHMHTKRRV